MKLRLEFEAQATPQVPWNEKNLLWDEEDAFGYTNSVGGVTGWNRNTEIWWRNRRLSGTEGLEQAGQDNSEGRSLRGETNEVGKPLLPPSKQD